MTVINWVRGQENDNRFQRCRSRVKDIVLAGRCVFQLTSILFCCTGNSEEFSWKPWRRIYKQNWRTSEKWSRTIRKTTKSGAHLSLSLSLSLSPSSSLSPSPGQWVTLARSEALRGVVTGETTDGIMTPSRMHILCLDLSCSKRSFLEMSFPWFHDLVFLVSNLHEQQELGQNTCRFRICLGFQVWSLWQHLFALTAVLISVAGITARSSWTGCGIRHGNSSSRRKYWKTTRRTITPGNTGTGLCMSQRKALLFV